MASQNSRSAPKKPKLVRDSFTIPKTEYAAIDALKSRAIALGTSVKKSELIRAGLMALQGLSDAAYKGALAAVPTLKTGRPVADKPAEPPVAVAPKKQAASAAAPTGAAPKKTAAGKTTPKKAAPRKAAPVRAAPTTRASRATARAGA